MPKYKWANPHEWLLEKAQGMNEAQLFQIVSALVGRLDSDSVQDLFQSEMDADGYFRDEEETDNASA